ncbi:MAG: polysaccharide ABC transporter ATP-binding protein [Syntrophobacter sp.]
MSDSSKAVIFDQVGKKFCRNLKRSLYYGFLDVSRIFAGMRCDTGALRPGEFWALSDIRLNVDRGTSLGVIGSNGSGKSTLLRLISGIYSPDRGKVTVDGKVGSLITLGAGFHPHFTGSENIFFNGTLLGLTKNELKARYDKIVEFSGLENFIDTPVSTYSTGMRMRLGFAIAIHTDPEILLIDEILGVGDVSFIKRCYDRIEQMVAERGITAVVVSHNIGMVQKLCGRTLVLDKGAAMFHGDTLEAISRYYESSMANDKASAADDSGQTLIHHPDCPRDLSVEHLMVVDQSGTEGLNISTPDPATFTIKVANNRSTAAEMPTVNILILDPGMINLFVNIQSHGLGGKKGRIPPGGSLVLECELPYLNLGPGEYKVIAKLGGPKEGIFHDSVMLKEPLKVSWSSRSLEKMSSLYRDCKLIIPSEWRIL